MNQTVKWVGGIAVVALVVWGALAANKNQNQESAETSQPVKVGFMGPLTGDAAGYGESIKRGVELAIEDLGANVELIVVDTKCSGADAVSGINKLISVDKVVAIVGEVCSSATLAAAPVAEQNQVVLISASSTSPELTAAGDYVFRVVPSDALQGAFGAQLVYNQSGRKLAVLYSNEDYGIGFEKVLAENFTAQGGEVVASEGTERASTDLRTQLTKIKAAGPDSLYLISNSPAQMGAMLKQIKELGLTATIYGAEGFKADEILTDVGQSAEGLIVSTVSSGGTNFAEAHNAAYGEGPGPFAAQAYDAMMALGKAIQDGARTGEAIKNALYDLEFDGASGRIVFDANGDVSGNYDVFMVRDGQFVQE